MVVKDKTIVRNPDVVFREDFNDGAILFNAASDRAFSLNDAGVFIWKRLDGEHTLQELIAEMVGEYKSPPNHIEGDILAFLDALSDKNLIGYKL